MDKELNEELQYIELIYNEIINNAALFLSKLGLKDDIVGINVLVKYMIQNGYLTNNQVLGGSDKLSTDELENTFFRLDNAGLLVPYGCSICRHIANFLFSLYNFLGFGNSELFVYRPLINVDFNSLYDMPLQDIQKVLDSLLCDYDLEGEYDFETIITRDDITFDIAYTGADEISKIFGNHALNLVLDRKGQMHLFDSTSNLVGVKDDNERVIKMYQSKDFFLKWFVRDFYNSHYEETHGKFNNALWLLENFSASSVQSDMREIKMYEEECLKLVAEFERFKIENRDNYDGVSRSVAKLIRSLEK